MIEPKDTANTGNAEMESGYKNKFEQLAKLGVADFKHLNGNLIDHLKGTQELLASWSASQNLQDAGLYHAAYGTAGLDEKMVSTDQRSKIAEIIGIEAEEIVYQYCACDRDYFWPQLGLVDDPNFHNRFNDQTYQLSSCLLKNFCELTVANELEIAMNSPEFIAEHGHGLRKLFNNMGPLLSVYANKAVAAVHGQCK
jgi:hypothetical protein